MKKAIFAINSKASKAFLIEEIGLNDYPTPDVFVWWAGIRLVVCSTNDDVVDWFIDGNPYIRIVEEEPNEYHLMKVEHAPHISSVSTIQDAFKAVSIEQGGKIAGCTYTIPNCKTLL